MVEAFTAEGSVAAGFRGGGFYGGGYRGFRGGYGFGRYGYGFGGYGFGLGLGLAGLYDFGYFGDPWYYYYPAGFAYGGYGDYGDGYGYGYDPEGDVSTNVTEPPAGRDPWVQESNAEQGPAATSAGGVPCGHWVWNAAQSRYHWDDSAC